MLTPPPTHTTTTRTHLAPTYRCPFKSTTSQGTPLAVALDARQWAQILDAEDGEEVDGEDGSEEEEEEEEDGQEQKAEGKRQGKNEKKKKKKKKNLAKFIKEGTKVSHKAAENVHFVRNFIRGKIEKVLYKQLVGDLYHVYRALEGKLDAFRDDAMVKPIYFPVELRRLPALERDMEYWFGNDWRIKGEQLRMTPCTAEYVARIESCNPEQLVAHSYTRYLGDLSGGQTLMRRARKSLVGA